MANKEIGRIGQRRYGGTIYEEFLHELRGTRGIEVYREMSENDDVVGAILFAIEMLVRQCDWNVEPGGDTATLLVSTSVSMKSRTEALQLWRQKILHRG